MIVWLKDYFKGLKSLTIEQIEFDNKLEKKWYEEYVIYLKFQVTTYEDCYMTACKAYDRLKRLPKMFHNKKRGEKLLDEFLQKHNPPPILLLKQDSNEKTLSNFRETEINLKAKIVSLDSYRQKKKREG